MHATSTDTRLCAAGDGCRDFDFVAKHSAFVGEACPLCPECLRTAARDIALLPHDYVDLEQQLPPSLGEWSDGQPRGSGEPPAPLRTHVEALQREIVHVTTTWAAELRSRTNLVELPTRGVRDGWALQRAVDTLAPRVRMLAQLPPTAVFPTSVEDTPQDVAGWEAVLQLAELHHRARTLILGRGRRRFWVPGECWQEACAEAHRQAVVDGTPRGEWLWRSEPSFARDEPPVYCRYCGQYRTYDEYRRYVELLVWPARHSEGVAA